MDQIALYRNKSGRISGNNGLNNNNIELKNIWTKIIYYILQKNSKNRIFKNSKIFR